VRSLGALLLMLLLTAAGAAPTSGQTITGLQPESGAPGTTVEIYGTGFSTTATDNTVKFGGKTAQVNSAKSTVIYAEVPSGPEGPVEVSVTISGTTVTSGKRFGVVTGGSGTFADIGAGLTGVDAPATAIADVDGDGDQDVLVAGDEGSDSPSTTLYEQQPDGSFQAAGAGLIGLRYASVSIADVDGDGDKDLLVAGRASGDTPTTILYKQQSDGSFSAANAGLTDVQDAGTSIADVDGDGDQDLLIAGEKSDGSDLTTLYKQQSDGSFSAAGAGLKNLSNASTSIADIDGDGDQDLLITGIGSFVSTVLYEQQSDGSFFSVGALTGVQNGSVSIADVDGDGDQDLLVAGLDGDNNRVTTLYKQQSDGTFSAANAGLPCVNGAGTSIADVDGDGDQDLLIAGNFTTALYEQQSDGSFSAANAGLTGVENASTSISDVDGDGDQDLLVAGNGGSRVATLYENDDVPTVTAITRSSPTKSTTNQSSVDFSVSFSETVSGIDTGDFTLGRTPDGGASISNVSTSGDTTVTVDGISGTGALVRSIILPGYTAFLHTAFLRSGSFRTYPLSRNGLLDRCREGKVTVSGQVYVGEAVCVGGDGCVRMFFCVDSVPCFGSVTYVRSVPFVRSDLRTGGVTLV